MIAATEERAEDTIATEEETKAEAERLDKLLRQIEAEHKLCYDFMAPKRAKWLRRLRLRQVFDRRPAKVRTDLRDVEIGVTGGETRTKGPRN